MVCKFNEIRSVQKVLKKAHKLVSKVNKSAKATEMLIARARKKLIARELPYKVEFNLPDGFL